jgi:hypothetical protein
MVPKLVTIHSKTSDIIYDKLIESWFHNFSGIYFRHIQDESKFNSKEKHIKIKEKWEIRDNNCNWKYMENRVRKIKMSLLQRP